MNVMERQKRILILLSGTFLIACFVSCAEDSKGKRTGATGTTNPTEPAPLKGLDAKKACFENKRKEEINAGRNPDNVKIYEECGFFQGEFGWRVEYEACKKSGKVWDGEKQTCSSIPADAGPCTYEIIEEKWGAVFENFEKTIDAIKDDGYEADQCGTAQIDGKDSPYLVFNKYSVKTLESGAVEEKILYKFVREEE